ncbi:hypothetical protein [Variovorax sp. E3]|uniref:hypothetical protein n=1 Tax=Variovorax sp. E3 TaxID=1914993 RepID=UPI0022B6467A|nr:hypothetical protein [Variovorax sp. E3]
MIKKIFGFLFSPLLLTLLALIVVALLIWWVGPLVKIGALAPLESEMVRAVVIGVIVLVVLLRALYRRWRARRASQHLTDGLMKAPAARTGAPASGEQQILDTRFSEAVATLKQMRLHAAGKKRAGATGCRSRAAAICTTCRGTCSSARRARARPPRSSTRA